MNIFKSCKYKVVNSNGGVLGGYKTLEAAQDAKKRWEREYRHDTLNKGMTVSIVKC